MQSFDLLSAIWVLIGTAEINVRWIGMKKNGLARRSLLDNIGLCKQED